MFNKVKELDSTKALFFGHDHVNLLDYVYEDIRFVYGLKTGFCAYYDNDRVGTTLISIFDDIKNIDVQFKKYSVE